MSAAAPLALANSAPADPPRHDVTPAATEIAAPRAIEGDLTIYQAGEWRVCLRAWVAQGAPLRIDLSRVTEIDSAGFQLLVATEASAREARIDLTWTDPSPAVREVCAVFGVDFVGSERMR